MATSFDLFPFRVLCGVVLALAAAQLAAVVRAQVPGPNVNMVSGRTLPDGDPFLQRQNEPSGAVSTRNPLHLLAGANDYRTVDLPGLPEWANTGDAWLGVFKSYNGGQTWRSTLLPGYPQDTSAEGLASPIRGYQAGADPTVRSGPNGLFYYSGIAFNRGTNGLGTVFVSRFIDNNNAPGGESIVYLNTTAFASGTSGRFLDKPYLAVDVPRAGAATCRIQAPGTSTVQSFPAGAVYVAWIEFDGTDSRPHSKLMLSRSLDCGATWSKPVKINERSHVNQGVAMAIHPATGALYLTWREFADSNSGDAILFSKSTSLGNPMKFTSPLVVPFKPFDQGTSTTTFRTNSYPSIAIDANGRGYTVFTERGWGPESPVPAGSTLPPGDARVVIMTSPDGLTWGSRRPVENTPLRGHQIMPVITVVGGTLSLVYYDLREDVSSVFRLYVDERNIVTRRHTLDLRVAQADPGEVPAFDPSVKVSRYLTGSRPGSQVIEQLQFNVPNLPLFAQGTSPFIGDFVDVAGLAFVQDANRKWIFNSSAATGSPLVYAFWTDNRDVRPPLDGNWANYTPPASAFTSQPCTPGQTGMRNSNVYSARVSPGLVVGAPTNTKRLRAGFRPEDYRSFVVFAQNNTDVIRRYRFTIVNQPPGGQASFLQFSPPGEPLTTLDVNLAPRSTASRTVYVTSSDAMARVEVTVVEVALDTLQIKPDGLQSSVVLNPDVANPDVANPDVANEVFNPDIANPDVANPDVANPDIANPDVANPDVANVVLANPDIANPDVANPDVANPDVANPDIANPDIANPDIANGSLVDVSWTVKNTGNNAGSFAVKPFLAKNAPAGFKKQLILHKTYTTPVTTSAECGIKTQTQTVLVANIVNPDVANPDVANPDVANPDVANPDIANATLWLEPGESGRITVRVLAPDRTKVVPKNVRQSDGTAGTVLVDPAFDPTTTVVPVVQPQAVNTADAQAGITTPPVSMALIVKTTALADGLVSVPYGATLAATGGTSGSTTWSLVPNAESGELGTLPPGLVLNPATGTISGVPLAAGAFPFTVQVTDSATPPHANTRDLFIRIAPYAVPQSAATVEDQSVALLLSALGANNAALSFAVTTPPARGALSGAAPGVVYAPAGNFYGADTFAFTATLLTSIGCPVGVAFCPLTSPPALVSIAVAPVNDAPSFAKGADQGVLEGSGTHTVPAWATALSAGPANETDGACSPFNAQVCAQTLAFTVTTDRPGLFSAPPAIAPDGTLAYTLAPDANGLAVATVVLSDSGGTANGGIDTSAVQSFTIAVAPVNSAPVATPQSTGTLEDASVGIVLAGSDVETAPVNLAFAVLAQPAHGTLSGTAPNLTYTPSPDYNGADSFTFKVTDRGDPDACGTPSGFCAAPLSSSAATVSITVTPVNDAPSFTKGADQVTVSNAGLQTVTEWAVDLNAGPPDESTQTLDFIVTADNPSLFSVQPAISPTGTLTYTPSTSGTAVVRVQIHDDGGTANGGVDTGPIPPQTFVITIVPPLVITTSSLPDAVAPWDYGGCLAATGGRGPRTWAIDAGALPAGIALDADGCFSGKALKTGSFTFTVRVSDPTQQSEPATLTIRGGTVDQAEWRIDQQASTPAIDFGGETSLAQTFVPAVDGYLLAVQIPVYCDNAGLRVEIRSGAFPGGGSAGQADIASEWLSAFGPSAAVHRQLKLPAPVFLAKGAAAAIVLASAGSCHVVQTPASTNGSSSYPYGDAFIGAASSWTPLALADPTRPDIPFHTIVDEGGRFAFMLRGRSQQTATVLTTGPNAGMVLLAGGSTRSTQLYNPSAVPINGIAPGRFVDGPDLNTTRTKHTATRLSDGWVLVTGGFDGNGVALASAELYDPDANVWVPLATTMTIPRSTHTATPIGGDAVLIVGGRPAGPSSNPVASTELFLYDASTRSGLFAAGPPMLNGRADHAAVRLEDGRVLLTGGWGTPSQARAEIYDPQRNAIDSRSAGSMQEARAQHTATLLACPTTIACSYGGKVLIAGGSHVEANRSATKVELFDPVTSTFSTLRDLEIRSREGHQAVRLVGGQVLLAGGVNHAQAPLSTMEIFDPAAESFTSTGDLAVARSGLTATHLTDDTVLVAGGWGPSTAAPYTAERFDPATDVLAAGRVRQAFTAAIAGFGAAPNTFTIRSGGLPAGLQLDSSTGVISGTPTDAGTTRLVVEILDSSTPAQWILRSVTIQIN